MKKIGMLLLGILTLSPSTYGAGFDDWQCHCADSSQRCRASNDGPEAISSLTLPATCSASLSFFFPESATGFRAEVLMDRTDFDQIFFVADTFFSGADGKIHRLQRGFVTQVESFTSIWSRFRTAPLTRTGADYGAILVENPGLTSVTVAVPQILFE